MAISRSTAAQSARWSDSLDLATGDAEQQFSFDAVYLEVGIDWDSEYKFIAIVRKRYPIVPFVLVGSRSHFLNSLSGPLRERFSNYFFLDTSTPLAEVEESVADTLAQVEWDIRARYGEMQDD